MNLTTVQNFGRRDAGPRPGSSSGLMVGLASSEDEVRETQRLRYQVFAEEVGARSVAKNVVDVDEYDQFCQHLLVRDRASGEVIACTRILIDSWAREAGGFHAQTRFQLDTLLEQPGRVAELGRICIAPGYRNGAAITMLWAGLMRFADLSLFSRIIGCCGVEMQQDGSSDIASLYRYLVANHFAAPEYRVTPRLRVPGLAYVPLSVAPVLPPVLKAYMRLGAQICGEPCWDPVFQTASFMMVLKPGNLRQHYARRFLAVA